MPSPTIYTIPHHIDVFCEGGLLGWSVRTSFITEPTGGYRIESYSDGALNRGRKRRVNRPLGWREVARHVNKVGTLQLWGDFRDQVEINGIDEPWERDVIVALMLRGTDFGSMSLGRFLLTLPDEDIARLYSLRGSLLTDESIADFRPLTDVLKAVRVRYRGWDDLKRLAREDSDKLGEIANGLIQAQVFSHAKSALHTGRLPSNIDWSGLWDCMDDDRTWSAEERALPLAGWLKAGNPDPSGRNPQGDAHFLHSLLGDEADDIFRGLAQQFRAELESLTRWTLERAKDSAQTLSRATPRTYGGNSGMILGQHRSWVNLGAVVQKAADAAGVEVPLEWRLDV